VCNNNAANHAMLRAQAQQAVQQFQRNPARFLGQLAPNLVPLPKAQALAQMERLEAGATRALAANEQRFARAYTNLLGNAEGTTSPGSLRASPVCSTPSSSTRSGRAFLSRPISIR
jgi:hypothetical protein